MLSQPIPQSTNQSTVTLFRRGQLLEIIPPVDGLIAEFLSVQHIGRATAKAGFLLEPKPLPLIWPDSDAYGEDYYQTFAGLEPAIQRVIESHGCQVLKTGKRPQTLPEPKWKKLPSKKTGDQQLLRFVQNNERGLVWYREPNVEVAWLIAQIALAFPREKIVVLTTRDADARVLWKRLKRMISGVTLAKKQYQAANVGRVIVATPSGLQQITMQIERRTICICLNPTEVFNTRRIWIDCKDWFPVLKSRMYGLLNEDLLLAPQQRDYLNALFGAEWLFIPRHGFRELPVTVKYWKFCGGNHAKSGLPTHELKRKLVWNNSKRNRLIAGLAQAVVSEDDRALGKKFPSIAKDLYRKIGRRVAVMVENLEHAAKLLERLPDWPVVAEKASGTRHLSQKVRGALAVGSTITAQKTQDVIVTTKAFAKVGAIDILIRADAGVALPPIASEFFVTGNGVSNDLTIIDVDDRHHPHLRQRSKWRREAYRHRGWQVDGPGVDHEQTGFVDYPPSAFHPDRPNITSISYLRPLPNDPKINVAEAAYKRRRKERALKKAQKQTCITLKEIADHEMLIECFKELRQHGGWGAGTDEITYSTLSPSEWAEVFRRLSKTLLKSRYRPQEARKVAIPKPGSVEHRILSLRSICDRVVALAVYRSLEPHLDRLFLDGSWGFRRGRDTCRMLAHLKHEIEKTGRWFMVVEDVRQAFDNVRVDDLIEAHQKAQHDLADTKQPSSIKINNSVLKLVAVMARSTTQNRTVGIDQGNNYSPIGLNVVLHYLHDLPLNTAVNHPVWYRYADNLSYLCHTESEGQQVLSMVQQLLEKAELKLKGKGGIIDLREKPATLLGFQLQERDHQLHLSLSEDTWNHLKQQLAETHYAADPMKIAQEVIIGWVNAFGLAFEKDGVSVSRICAIAAQYGFRELDRKQIEKVANQAGERWEKMVQSQQALALPSPTTPLGPE